MMAIMIGVLGILGTIVAYFIGNWIYTLTKSNLLLPIFTATVLIIIVLIVFNINYETYMIGAKWVDRLLGPAVVALAYPLYQNRKIVKELFFPIVGGTLIGAFIGLVTGIYFAKLLGTEGLVVFSIAPKSVTTPVAMEVAAALGGSGSIAAIFVMIAGIGGVMISPIVFRIFNIQSAIGRGVGLGSASHAIGTVKALEHSDLDASISTVAMILSAIFVAILTPILIGLIM